MQLLLAFLCVIWSFLSLGGITPNRVQCHQSECVDCMFYKTRERSTTIYGRRKHYVNDL